LILVPAGIGLASAFLKASGIGNIKV
jgi:hypothetical protein